VVNGKRHNNRGGGKKGEKTKIKKAPEHTQPKKTLGKRKTREVGQKKKISLEAVMHTKGEGKERKMFVNQGIEVVTGKKGGKNSTPKRMWENYYWTLGCTRQEEREEEKKRKKREIITPCTNYLNSKEGRKR